MKEYVSNYKTCIDRFPSSRFVYTFVYEDPKNNFEEFINKQQTGKWTLCDIYDTDQNELFEHISSLVSGNTGNLKNTLAVSMKHKEYCEIQLEYKDKDCEFKFCLKNVWLILFKTKVGFIVVDTCIDRDSDPDKLITLNYYLKSLKLTNNDNKKLTRLETKKETIKRYDENNNDLFHQLNITSLSDGEKVKIIRDGDVLKALKLNLEEKHAEEVSVEITKDVKLVRAGNEELLALEYVKQSRFNYRSFFVSLLEGIKIETFFNSFYSKSYQLYLPSKAHVFTAALMGGDKDEELPDLLYWLRKGYKKSYTPDEDSRQLRNNEEVVRCFNESVWGVSREGVANIVQEGCTFLAENYYSRLDLYFYLYLLVLHQYYGLLALSKDASTLSNKASDYINPEEYKKLRDIKERFNFFYLKCIFHETSHISHQSRLYKCMWDRLGVNEILTEIQFEIERISSIIEEVREEEAYRQKETQEKRNKAFIIIAGIFTVVSTFDSVLSVLTTAKALVEEGISSPIKLVKAILRGQPDMLILTSELMLFLCGLGLLLFILWRVFSETPSKLGKVIKFAKIRRNVK